MAWLHNYSIDFFRINLCWRESKEDSFENMCKEFLQIKYKIADNINLKKNYPWIECPPVLGINSIYYWFQAKLTTWTLKEALKSSFFDKLKKHKIYRDDLKKMSTLVIFSNKEKTKNEFESFFLEYNIKFVYFVWEDLKNELNKPEFIKIRQKYFWNEDIERELHELNRDLGVRKAQDGKSPYSWDLWDVEVGFFKTVSSIDVENAKSYLDSFLSNKYLYCDSYSFTVFDELENKIPQEKFKSIALHTKGSPKKTVEEILVYAEHQLDRMRNDRDYIGLKFFVPEAEHKKGLFINYWVEWKSKIDIDENEDKIFISKL